ncbi:MAG: hypothetical protein ACXW3Z_00425 [Limisphaerales bacterium]
MKIFSFSVHPIFANRAYGALMKKCIALCFCLFALIVTRAEEPLQKGDVLPSFKAKDQHGREFELKPGVQRLFVSFDMSAGKHANSQFAAAGADFLPDAHAVFVSSIYGMPAIGRAFALPKMRKYPHRIILADSEKLLTRYPQQKDRVTVLSLDQDLRITGIAFWNPKEKLPTDLVKSAAN